MKQILNFSWKFGRNIHVQERPRLLFLSNRKSPFDKLFRPLRSSLGQNSFLLRQGWRRQQPVPRSSEIGSGETRQRNEGKAQRRKVLEFLIMPSHVASNNFKIGFIISYVLWELLNKNYEWILSRWQNKVIFKQIVFIALEYSDNKFGDFKFAKFKS